MLQVLHKVVQNANLQKFTNFCNILCINYSILPFDNDHKINKRNNHYNTRTIKMFL